MVNIEDETNENINLIRGDPKEAIRKLSVPTMASMFLIMLYNLTDSLWVAGLGADSLAALGFMAPLFFIIVGLGNGLGAGANSLIARSIGARDKSLADNAAVHSILLTIVLSIVIPIIIMPFLKDILLLMGASSAVSQALEYGNIVLVLMVVFILSSVQAAILRAEGDVKRAMYAIGITTVLNIIIDPLFIYIFKMGVSGAAWATVLSSFLSIVLMSYWLWIKKDTYLSVNLSSFKYENSIIKDISLVAVPNMAENLVFSVLVACENIMFTIVAGTTAVAVYTSAVRINQLAEIPLMGIGTAMLTVAGAAFGAKDFEKLEQSHTYSILLGYAISAILCIIMFFGSDYIALIFAYTPESAALAPAISNALKILCFFLLALPCGVMSSMVFQGLGKGTISLVLTIFRALIVEIIFAYILGINLGFGESGIYAGLVLGSAFGNVISYIWCKLYIKNLKTNSI